MSQNKKHTLFISIFIASLLLTGFTATAAKRVSKTTSKTSSCSLIKEFQNPPSSAKPKTWWHWVSGWVSREGITADLEAMKKAGIGGAFVFHVEDNKRMRLDGPVKFRSAQWWDLMKFASSEAKRLGLELGFHNCPGWSSSGGPWITPDKSMQKLIWSEKIISGPVNFENKLPQAYVDKKWNYYRDIAVLAIPTQDSTLKASDIIDISAKMDTAGKLTWQVPTGNWKIIRIGRTTTGKGPAPATPGGEGLECDKLDRQGVDAHFDAYIAKILENAGSATGKSLTTVFIDSYESGDQNWSVSFREEFKKRRGYDPVPWLVTLTKYVVDNKEVTERFNNDWKRTIAELFAQNYYGYMAERVHRYPGLKFGLEPYSGPFDGMNCGTYGDEVTSEFWQSYPSYKGKFLNSVASVAHVAGIRIAAAEAFTCRPYNGKWQQYPYVLKFVGDREFCNGINQMVLHTSVHQPWTNVWPGMTMSWWGTHFGRTQTWWDKAYAWTGYLTRCQAMLQKGQFMADICYLTRNTGGVPSGYDADLCGEDLFLKSMTVVDGRLTLPSGMSYRVLVLPVGTTITPAIARKVRELVNAGATVVGPKPMASPSLQNYPECDKEVQQIAAELWDSGKIISDNSSKSVLKVLTDKKIKPDFKAEKSNVSWIHRRIDNADVYFVANQDSTDRVVECSFRVDGMQPELWDPNLGEMQNAKSFSCVDGVTKLPIHFDPNGSTFVVFRNKAIATVAGNNWPEYITEQQITGAWKVNFDPRWGGPAEVTFDTLTDWTKRSESSIRYYSGTAIYKKEFTLANKNKDARLWLDLGVLKNIAEVWLNGQNLGVTWKVPYRIELTKAIRQGNNKLEIRVTNLWPNRLIGDEQEPADCEWNKEEYWPYNGPKAACGTPIKKIPDWLVNNTPRPSKGRFTFTTWNFYVKDSPLLQSGLIGPVNLISEK